MFIQKLRKRISQKNLLMFFKKNKEQKVSQIDI